MLARSFHSFFGQQSRESLPFHCCTAGITSVGTLVYFILRSKRERLRVSFVDVRRVPRLSVVDAVFCRSQWTGGWGDGSERHDVNACKHNLGTCMSSNCWCRVTKIGCRQGAAAAVGGCCAVVV